MTGNVIPFYKVIERPITQYSPPHNLRVEHDIIATALIYPEKIANLIEAGLKAEHFYNEQNQKIWIAIVKIFIEQKVVTHTEILERIGIRESENAAEYRSWLDYLERIQDDSSPVISVPQTIQMLHNYYILRLLFQHCLRTLTEIAKTNAEEENISELLNRYHTRVLEISTEIKKREKTLSELAVDEVKSVDNPVEKNRIETGFTDIDRKVNILPGMLVIIAGRPSSGKTAFLMNIILNACRRDGTGSVFFSLDNSEEQVRRRFMAMAGGPPLWKILQLNQHRGESTEYTEILLAAQELYSTGEKIRVLCGNMTPQQMYSTLTKSLKLHPEIKMFAVDYLQIMNPLKQGRLVTREQEVASNIMWLKKISQELGLVAIVLSQLRKLPVKVSRSKDPDLSDLRDTGQIEQDADVVLMLHKSAVNVVKVSIAKNKDGETGIVMLHFDGEHMKFNNLELKY